MLYDAKKPLSALAGEIPDYPQKLENVTITEDKRGLWSKTPEINDIIQQAQTALGSSGRILVRESGTEPLLRVMVEAAKPEQVDEWTAKISDVVRQCLCN